MNFFVSRASISIFTVLEEIEINSILELKKLSEKYDHEKLVVHFNYEYAYLMRDKNFKEEDRINLIIIYDDWLE